MGLREGGDTREEGENVNEPWYSEEYRQLIEVDNEQDLEQNMRRKSHRIIRQMYMWRCLDCGFWTYDEELALVHETGIP